MSGYTFPGVQLFRRNVYGVTKIYPANTAGNLFAELLRVKTFSPAQVELMRDLGHPVAYVADAEAAKVGA